MSGVYHFAASELEEQGRKTALDWQDFMPEHLNASANTPFLVGLDTFTSPTTHCYYFWFFGYVAKLPYSTIRHDRTDTVPTTFGLVEFD